MDRELSDRLERIEGMLERLMAMQGASPAPARAKGDPSLLQVNMEAARLAEIYQTEGREAMKAAFRKRNDEARARRKRRA